MKILIIVLFLFFSFLADAQNHSSQYMIHSHNDYLQDKPLLGALEAGAESIEADLFLVDGELYVAHTRNEISKENTFENLYILPLKRYLSDKKGTPDFHLMIDIKTAAIPTLKQIEQTLLKYPDVFSKDGIRVIISGNRPNPEDYQKYATFIFFDGREPADAEGPGADRVAVISQNLSMFTQWRGEGEIPQNEKQKIIEFVNACHAKNKPVRFWNTGDTETMYDFLRTVGVNYINTDKPGELRLYLEKK